MRKVSKAADMRKVVVNTTFWAANRQPPLSGVPPGTPSDAQLSVYPMVAIKWKRHTTEQHTRDDTQGNG